MPEYTVTWEVQLDAESPEEAARLARAWQRNAACRVGCFEVTDEAGEIVLVDLDERDELAAIRAQAAARG